MIPSPPEHPDLPEIPERPIPIRATPPSAASWLGLLEELQQKLRDVEKRVDGLEERLRAVEGHRHA
jgi:hypothetical protein